MKVANKIAFLLTLILCSGLLGACTNQESSARSRIRDLTDIDIPSSAEMVYHQKPEDNFFPVPGRQSQYTVFKFEEKPTEFLSENNFKNERNDDFESYYDQRFNSYSYVYDTPNEYHPKWDNEYLWLDTSIGIYFVYFTESRLLIVFVTST